MAKPTAPRRPRLTADQRLYTLGYDQGYNAGYADGLRAGNDAAASR
jgi:hypothetical protein